MNTKGKYPPNRPYEDGTIVKISNDTDEKKEIRKLCVTCIICIAVLALIGVVVSLYFASDKILTVGLIITLTILFVGFSGFFVIIYDENVPDIKMFRYRKED